MEDITIIYGTSFTLMHIHTPLKGKNINCMNLAIFIATMGLL